MNSSIVVYHYIVMFSIISYDSYGLVADRIDFIRDLCHNHEFVIIQETWSLSKNLSIFNDRNNFVSCHGISAMDSTQILVGRLHLGCSILWKSNLESCWVTPLNSCNTFVCAVGRRIMHFLFQKHQAFWYVVPIGMKSQYTKSGENRCRSQGCGSAIFQNGGQNTFFLDFSQGLLNRYIVVCPV